LKLAFTGYRVIQRIRLEGNTKTFFLEDYGHFH
jgi:hypothetical protein